MIKFKHFLIGLFVFAPSVALAAGTDFTMAAQLLSAARNGNVRLVQNLINSGADVNYTDSTGVSVVCTAVMNNDIRAVQILQMYGADASNCDRQIKDYNARTNPTEDSGVFSGLSSTHRLVLTVVGAGAVIAGLLWATDAFDSNSGGHSGNGNSGGHGSNSGDDSSGSLKAAFTVPYGPKMVDAGFDYDTELNLYSSGDFLTNFEYMNTKGNYLLMMHGYSTFARGYMGQSTLRYADSYAPVPASLYGAKQLEDMTVSGGIPINVALITANGINAAPDTSLADMFFLWSKVNGTSVLDATNTMMSSKYFNNTVALGGDSMKVSDDNVTENTSFDLYSNTTAIHNTDPDNPDNILAKIVGGYTSGAATGDFIGFMPNGQMTIYRTGGDDSVFYYNYKALANAALNSVENATTAAATPQSEIGRAKISVIANTDVISPLYAADTKTVSDFINLNSANYQSTFYDWAGDYYGNGLVSGANSVKHDAESFFSGLGIDYFPMVVFSVGGTLTDSYYTGENKPATFENAAPLAFSGAKKLFMSVVAVNLPGVDETHAGTTDASSVSGFSTSAKYAVSQWHDSNTGEYYKGRICGIAGLGMNSVDPWCFAGAGVTDEQATAAVAGAAGAVKAAFSYMSNQDIFTLLALTADGAYLGTNPTTGAAWGSTTEAARDALVSYLSSMYSLPTGYQSMVDNNTMSYLDAFKYVFGYGLVNLERATTPGKSVYYYTNGKIVSSAGNAYWRAAQNTVNHSSSVFGVRTASIPVSFYDVLTSADESISMPRIWNAEVSFGTGASRYGLYMGDTLAELKTHDTNNTVEFGDNLKFGFARSERAYDDNMSGLDYLSLAYDTENFGVESNYQHYLTDGAGRFTGLANPVLSLASNAVTSRVDLHNGKFTLSGRGFIGYITTEGLLESDPAISHNFEAAKLGDVMGAESGIKWSGEKLSLVSNIGTMHESNTVLGAAFDGILDMGGADTNYIDSVLEYNFTDDIGLTLRGTFAWTHTGDMNMGIINGVSDLRSNAFAAGVRFGNFDFVASMPLALTNGSLGYSYAEFAVDDDSNVVISDAGTRRLDLTPSVREYRFNASYRHSFGEWTDGALGFIYRINPNNTDEFGNESIFMMKLSHRLGI